MRGIRLRRGCGAESDVVGVHWLGDVFEFLLPHGFVFEVELALCRRAYGLGDADAAGCG